MLAGNAEEARGRRVGRGRRACLDAGAPPGLVGATRKSQGHFFGGGDDQGGEMSEFRPREDVNADLWVGALDGPDAPVLRAAFDTDRYMRAEVETALREWPAWMRSLLVSHLARDLREHPHE